MVGVGRTSIKGNKVMSSTSNLSRMDLPVAPSQVADVLVVISSLVLGSSGIGSGVADLWWHKVVGLVEDGWTTGKGKISSPPFPLLIWHYICKRRDLKAKLDWFF